MSQASPEQLAAELRKLQELATQQYKQQGAYVSGYGPRVSLSMSLCDAIVAALQGIHEQGAAVDGVVIRVNGKLWKPS